VESATADKLSGREGDAGREAVGGSLPRVEVLRTPTGGFSIHIRGVNTFLGNGEPLYVVDGIAVQVEPGRGLDWLSPGEIERIDVLKNAPETNHVRRARRNGVILITTKRGR